MPSAPASPSERIDAIDVLRGLVLFGVLAINIVTEFRVSIFEQFPPAPRATPPIDRAVEVFLTTAIQSKALALFSFLFGVGLAIQFEQLAGNPRQSRTWRRLKITYRAIRPPTRKKSSPESSAPWVGALALAAIAAWLILPAG